MIIENKPFVKAAINPQSLYIYIYIFWGSCVVYLYNGSQQDALFLKFISVNNSICFGHTYCPSSGVLMLYSQQLVFVVLYWLYASEVRMALDKYVPIDICLITHTHTHTHARIYIYTHSLTPRCRVLLQKLTGLQLVKKFPAFHGTRRFITALTSGHTYLYPGLASCTMLPLETLPPGDPSGGVVYLRIFLSPEQASRMWVFLNRFCFYREGLLAPRPTPKLEDHPSSAGRDCLFNLFAATLLIRGRSSIRNLRTRHAVVTDSSL